MMTMRIQEFRPLEFEEWYGQNEENLGVEAAETGRDRELCYCPEVYAEEKYNEYLKEFEDNAEAHGGWFNKETGTTMADVGQQRDTLAG